MADNVKYGIEYDFSKSESNLKQILDIVQKHDKLIEKQIELIDELTKKSEDSSKRRVKNKSDLVKAEEKLAKAREKEAKQILKIREDIKALNRENREQIKLQKAEQTIRNTQVKSIKDLERVTNALVFKRRNLNTTTKEGVREYKALTEQIRENNAQLIRSDAEIGRSQRNVGNYAGAIKNATVQIAALAASILAIGKAVQATTRTFAEFETGQANVQTLLDQTNKNLSSQSIDLMQEYGLAVEDVNKALFDAVSAGIDAGEAIDFLSVASQLSIGGVTDLKTSVDGITSTLNAYRLNVSEANKVASAFFSAQRFGKTTVAELSAEIGTVAPIARKAGISFQELLSTFAILTKQGIRTNEATTAIKSTITALISPAAEAKKGFDELGIATGITAIKQEGFGQTLLKVAEATKTNEDKLTDLIPNVRALTGVGALGTAQLEEYEKILKTVSNDYGEGSSLSRAYAIQQETLNKAFDRFKASASAIAIAIGRFLAPGLKSVLNLLSPLKTNLEEVSFATQKQQSRFERLVITYQRLRDKTNKTNTELKLLNDTYGELQRTYPNYLASQENEIENYEEIDDQINNIRKDLKLLAKQKALAAIQSDLELERTEKQQEIYLKIIKIDEERARLEKEIDKRQNSALKKSTGLYISTGQSVETLKNTIFGLELQYKSLTEEQVQLEIAQKKQIESIKRFDKEISEQISKTGKKSLEIGKPDPIKIPIEIDDSSIDSEIAEFENDVANVEPLEIPVEFNIDSDEAPELPDFVKAAERAIEARDIIKQANQDETDSFVEQNDKRIEILKQSLAEQEVLYDENSAYIINLRQQTEEAITALEEESLSAKEARILKENEAFLSNFSTALDATSNLVEDFITGNEDALKNLGNAAKNFLVNLIKDFILATIKQQIIKKALEAEAVASATATGQLIATAYSNPATLASIATFGGAAVAGTTAVLAGLAAVRGASAFAEGGNTGNEKNRIIQVNDDQFNRPEYVINGRTTSLLGGKLDEINAIKTHQDAENFFSSGSLGRNFRKTTNRTGGYQNGGLATTFLNTTPDNSAAFTDLSRTVLSSSLSIKEELQSLNNKINSVSSSQVYLLSKNGEESASIRND